jgi:hypothetical protein
MRVEEIGLVMRRTGLTHNNEVRNWVKKKADTMGGLGGRPDKDGAQNTEYACPKGDLGFVIELAKAWMGGQS